MTNKEKTFSALNGHYLDESNGRICTEYLNDAIVLWGMNTRPLYDAIVNSRRKLTAVTWEVFTDLASEHLREEEYPQRYTCTSEQLKAWLVKYGDGYDTIKAAVDYFAAVRKEYAEK